MHIPPTAVRGALAPALPASGFTLIEVMVVVLILGMLAALVVPRVTDSADKARDQKAATDVCAIAGAVRLYYAEHGRLPALAELVARDAKGHTWLESLPPDPWNHDYVLRQGEQPRDFEVLSAGRDGELDSIDDISSRPPR